LLLFCFFVLLFCFFALLLILLRWLRNDIVSSSLAAWGPVVSSECRACAGKEPVSRYV
jgi:hypothetical protein